MCSGSVKVAVPGQKCANPGQSALSKEKQNPAPQPLRARRAGLPPLSLRQVRTIGCEARTEMPPPPSLTPAIPNPFLPFLQRTTSRTTPAAEEAPQRSSLTPKPAPKGARKAIARHGSAVRRAPGSLRRTKRLWCAHPLLRCFAPCCWSGLADRTWQSSPGPSPPHHIDPICTRSTVRGHTSSCRLVCL